MSERNLAVRETPKWDRHMLYPVRVGSEKSILFRVDGRLVGVRVIPMNVVYIFFDEAGRCRQHYPTYLDRKMPDMVDVEQMIVEWCQPERSKRSTLIELWLGHPLDGSFDTIGEYEGEDSDLRIDTVEELIEVLRKHTTWGKDAKFEVVSGL